MGRLSENAKKTLQSSKKNTNFLKPNISDTPFDQRTLVHLEALFQRFDKKTDIHTDIATYRLNQPMGQISEKRHGESSVLRKQLDGVVPLVTDPQPVFKITSIASFTMSLLLNQSCNSKTVLK